MKHPALLQKIFSFFLTKIVTGISVIVSLVALVEWTGRLILDETGLVDELKNVIIGIADAGIALSGYILLFTFYEKRKIRELSAASFPKNACTGFLLGLVLQSLLILIIYISGSYSIMQVNPVSFMLHCFTLALAAGFVA